MARVIFFWEFNIPQHSALMPMGRLFSFVYNRYVQATTSNFSHFLNFIHLLYLFPQLYISFLYISDGFMRLNRVDPSKSMIDRVRSNGQYTELVKSACMIVALDDRRNTIKQHAQATCERIALQDFHDANSTFGACTKATPRFDTLAQCSGPPAKFQPRLKTDNGQT